MTTSRKISVRKISEMFSSMFSKLIVIILKLIWKSLRQRFKSKNVKLRLLFGLIAVVLSKSMFSLGKIVSTIDLKCSMNFEFGFESFSCLMAFQCLIFCVWEMSFIGKTTIAEHLACINLPEFPNMNSTPKMYKASSGSFDWKQ